MLHAVLQQVRTWPESAGSQDVTIALDLRSGSFRQRRELGLYHLAWIDSYKLPFLGPLLNAGVSLWPTSLQQKWRWAASSQSELILDAAGFAHSDQFGPLYSELLWRRYQRAKAAGKKIVLLPQAFGPFANKQVAAVVKQIVQLADLVYARDPISYEHLVGLGLNGRCTHIKTAPDFTNLVTVPTFPGMPSIENQPCIIPNNRMMEKTDSDIRANYVSFLAVIIKLLQARGLQPFLLIHETQSDYPLAHLVQAQLDKPVSIVQEANALRIKWIIGRSSIVVGSRYHGLINGLTQNIPSLATGWSHKYEMLLAEYNCSRYLVSPLMPEDQVAELLNEMLEDPDRTAFIANLQAANERLKTVTRTMWAEVYRLLYGSDPAF